MTNASHHVSRHNYYLPSLTVLVYYSGYIGEV